MTATPRHRDETGIAMITAIMASVVVLTLSVMAVKLSLHDSDYSGMDRNRITTVHAAEAGLDVVFSRLQSATDLLPCSVSGKTTATPSAIYRADIQYFSSLGAALTSGATGVSATPGRALITSTSTLGNVRRTMQAEVRLTAIYGQFNKGIFSDASPVIDNNMTLWSPDGNVDFYTNGNVVCPTTTGGGMKLTGSLYAQGYIDYKNTCTVDQTAWVVGSAKVKGTLTIGGNLLVGTTAAQPTSTATVDAGGVGGVVVAQTCTGCTTGQLQGQTIGPPPKYEFPTVEFSASDWTAAGYTITTTTTCREASDFITALGPSAAGTKKVLYVTGCSLLSLGATEKNIKLYGDLAIVSTGSVEMKSSSDFRSGDGQRHVFHVIIPANLVTCANGSPSINIENQPGLDSLDIFFYAPKGCTVQFANANATTAGQVYAGKFESGQRVNLQYKAVFVPGVPNNVVTGWASEIAYVREIKPTS